MTFAEGRFWKLGPQRRTHDTRFPKSLLGGVVLMRRCFAIAPFMDLHICVCILSMYITGTHSYVYAHTY